MKNNSKMNSNCLLSLSLHRLEHSLRWDYVVLQSVSEPAHSAKLPDMPSIHLKSVVNFFPDDSHGRNPQGVINIRSLIIDHIRHIRIHLN